MSSVTLKNGLKKFAYLMQGGALRAVWHTSNVVVERIENWTPEWSGKHAVKSTPWKGYIEFNLRVRDGVTSQIVSSHPNKHAIMVAEFGRSAMRRETGIPIKKSREEAAKLLSELRQRRRDWISDYEVPDYLQDAKYIIREGVRRWNPLTSGAEQLLASQGIIIRKSVSAIPASFYITNLMRGEMKERLIGELSTGVKQAAKKAASSKENQVRYTS